MTIAIASGKGGTGKTTVAVGLAEVLGSDVGSGIGSGIGSDVDSEIGSDVGSEKICEAVRLLDCDVEEPNDHLFLGAEEVSREPFSILVPRIDEKKCTGCGECVEFCNFHALVQLGSKVMVFDNLCHGCGGCTLVCPENAISEAERPIGSMVGGKTRGVTSLYGILDVGEVLAPPLIRAVKRKGGAAYACHGSETDEQIIIDSPPGTTCPMVTSVKDADFALLVTENTPFGLHDLEMAVETIAEMDIPMGVVINRADVGHAEVEKYCRKMDIPIMMRIPYDEAVAAGYAKGRSIVQSVPAYAEQFLDLYHDIVEMLDGGDR